MPARKKAAIAVSVIFANLRGHSVMPPPLLKMQMEAARVIITGGYHGESLKSTEVLDLATRNIISVGDLTSTRRYLHVATARVAGQAKTFALGGFGSARESESTTYLNTVEEWEEETSTWKVADNLVYIRCYFGAVEVAKDVICSS